MPCISEIIIQILFVGRAFSLERQQLDLLQFYSRLRLAMKPCKRACVRDRESILIYHVFRQDLLLIRVNCALCLDRKI